jgi:hypothetical protein
MTIHPLAENISPFTAVKKLPLTLFFFELNQRRILVQVVDSLWNVEFARENRSSRAFFPVSAAAGKGVHSGCSVSDYQRPRNRKE